jgi:hypothetical protein
LFVQHLTHHGGGIEGTATVGASLPGPRQVEHLKPPGSQPGVSAVETTAINPPDGKPGWISHQIGNASSKVTASPRAVYF